MSAETPPPQTYEEWLETASIEEIVKGLYDRIEHLKEVVQTQDETIQTQDLLIKTLKTSMVTHKHTKETGECMLPAGVVIPLG